ncbi:MAG: phosphoglycerate kinase [archaeon]|nr:phosphoglycerate kinase [archaeon]
MLKLAYNFISDVDVKGKTVLFHSMMDLPVINGKIDTNSRRFLADLQDLKQLSEKGAKLVVFTWQSRPGKKDFFHLDQHAAEIGKGLGREVKQFNWDQDFVSAIKQMADGDIVFLDNVRMRPDQDLGSDKTALDYSKTEFVKQLAPLADFFCNNALSQSHRNECSILGFTPVLPCLVGPSLKREIESLDAIQSKGKPRVLLFGGMKNEDSVKLIPYFLKNDKIDLVLIGGFLGELFLKAKGTEFGKKDEWIAERDYLEFTDFVNDAKKVLEEFGEKIVLPVDLAVDANGERKNVLVKDLPTEFVIKDIGDKTIELFSEKINGAKTVIWNGPMGVYEKKNFENGTKAVSRAMTESNAFAVIGGGDTEAAVERLGFSKEKFSHVSLAGKAFLQYVSGQPLVGLEALNK